MAEMYSNIRSKELLGSFLGAQLVDVTQHDEEDFDPATGNGSKVVLMFDNGRTMTFPIGEEGFGCEHADDCDCQSCTTDEADEEFPESRKK